MAIRFAIVSVAMLYFHSSYFATIANNGGYILLARWAVSISFVVTLGFVAALLASTGISIARRIASLLHDVTAI